MQAVQGTLEACLRTNAHRRARAHTVPSKYFKRTLTYITPVDANTRAHTHTHTHTHLPLREDGVWLELLRQQHLALHQQHQRVRWTALRIHSRACLPVQVAAVLGNTGAQLGLHAELQAGQVAQHLHREQVAHGQHLPAGGTQAEQGLWAVWTRALGKDTKAHAATGLNLTFCACANHGPGKVGQGSHWPWETPDL